ncbi:MAG: HAD-IIB family hydrolase [Peptoniphilus sp.]|nr:HAD-IIB family hydrolase [Peptoniphilus sp.]MDD7362907.1 HAD-IIB family hydrolase [Bacillota bacterium]MDY6044147.1 HAD-IIB family hydrolase [Peptoniphilus sp.]
MIQLVALDFDGTIAARRQPFDKDMVAYIKRWRDIGIQTVVCSGRPYRSLKRELEAFDEELPIISNNGNLIRYKNSAETLFKNVFPKEYLKPICDAMIRRNIHPIFHVDSYEKGYDLVTLFETTEREASYISFYENLYRQLTIDEVLREDVLVIAGYTTPDVYEDLISEDALKKSGLTPHLLKSVDKKLSLFEIIGNSDKWRGLSVFAEKMGIDAADILAFGDDMNDKSMVEHAGIGVAMDSAPEAVKAVSDKICTVSPKEYGAFKLADQIIRKERTDEH